MRRLAVVALVAVGLTLPAFAQRGGVGHGGFSGHAGPSFSSGFSAPHFSGGFSAPHFSSGFTASRPYGFGSLPRYQPRISSFSPSFGRSPYFGRSYVAPVRSGFRAPYSPSGNNGNWHNNGGHNGGGGVHFTIRTAPVYPLGVGLGPYWYLPIGWNWDSNWNWGDSDSARYDNDAGYATQDYAPQEAADAEQPAYRDDYEPQAARVMSSSPEPPAVENATTLVFKDGRPPVQVHNYALTPSTLFVLDAQRRDIPVAELDLTATETVNRAAGVAFQLPKLPN